MIAFFYVNGCQATNICGAYETVFGDMTRIRQSKNKRCVPLADGHSSRLRTMPDRFVILASSAIVAGTIGDFINNARQYKKLTTVRRQRQGAEQQRENDSFEFCARKSLV